MRETGSRLARKLFLICEGNCFQSKRESVPSGTMKKHLLMVLGVIVTFAFVFQLDGHFRISELIAQEVRLSDRGRLQQMIDNAFSLLKIRKDKKALVILEQVLNGDPGNLDALWGKAEVLRRKRDYKEAQTLLNNVLKKNPSHSSALLSLSYIRLKENCLKDALKLVNRALVSSRSDKENQALAYVMLGTINATRAARGSFFSKITYGLRIKGYFLKARKLAPDLAEVHLAIGTFYLSAPKIIGGNLDLAIQELEQAVRIAPEFATANARLAAAFKTKGNLEKYNYYLKRARELDPQNEAVSKNEKPGNS